MFLLVPAYPGSPGQKAIKQLCVCVCVCVTAPSTCNNNNNTTTVYNDRLTAFDPGQPG